MMISASFILQQPFKTGGKVPRLRKVRGIPRIIVKLFICSGCLPDTAAHVSVTDLISRRVLTNDRRLSRQCQLVTGVRRLRGGSYHRTPHTGPAAAHTNDGIRTPGYITPDIPPPDNFPPILHGVRHFPFHYHHPPIYNIMLN